MNPAVADSVRRLLRTTLVGGWKLHEYDVVDSTNLVAAGLPAWEAVRADRQTAGRGRFQRRWISDEGGLWLSAVLPIPGEPMAVPLAVGLATCNALQALGVPRLRMRWPNDILASDRKLAGLLLDQFTPGLIVAGIGINVANQPEASDKTLKDATARLADLLPAVPSLEQLSHKVLEHLRAVVVDLQQNGFEKLLPRINQLWGVPRAVELDLNGTIQSGNFTHVDVQGRLVLHSGNTNAAFEPSQVRHLREL